VISEDLLLFTVANLEEAHNALLGVDHGHEDRVLEGPPLGATHPSLTVI
jgi:hypothetical protein